VRCNDDFLLQQSPGDQLSVDSNKQSGEGLDPIEASGGIFIYYASAKITNSTFSNNISSKNSAVGCIYSPNSIISNNVFYKNTGRYSAIAFAIIAAGCYQEI